MSTLYTQTTQNTYSNYNDGSNYWYAFSFVASATGVPTNIKLYCNSGSSGTGDSIYIRDQKSASSANYGYATGVAWSDGENSIALTGGATITQGNTYYVCVKITNSAAYPKFQYDTTKTTYGQWRSSTSNGDPTTDISSGRGDIKMTIDGTLAIAYIIAVMVGQYTITGINVNINKFWKLITQATAYTLTGIDIILKMGKGIVAMVGNFTVNGYDTIFQKALLLMTAVGEYTLTGIDVVFDKTKRLVATVGQYIMTGIMVNITGTGKWRWKRETKPTTTWSNNDKPSNSWTNIDKPL